MTAKDSEVHSQRLSEGRLLPIAGFDFLGVIDRLSSYFKVYFLVICVALRELSGKRSGPFFGSVVNDFASVVSKFPFRLYRAHRLLFGIPLLQSAKCSKNGTTPSEIMLQFASAFFRVLKLAEACDISASPEVVLEVSDRNAPISTHHIDSRQVEHAIPRIPPLTRNR